MHAPAHRVLDDALTGAREGSRAAIEDAYRLARAADPQCQSLRRGILSTRSPSTRGQGPARWLDRRRLPRLRRASSAAARGGVTFTLLGEANDTPQGCPGNAGDHPPTADVLAEETSSSATPPLRRDERQYFRAASPGALCRGQLRASAYRGRRRPGGVHDRLRVSCRRGRNFAAGMSGACVRARLGGHVRRARNPERPTSRAPRQVDAIASRVGRARERTARVATRARRVGGAAAGFVSSDRHRRAAALAAARPGRERRGPETNGASPPRADEFAG